jgi:hypothetical protein
LDPHFLIYLALNNTLNSFFNLDLLEENQISMWEFFSLLAYAYGKDEIARKFFSQYLNEPNSNILMIKKFRQKKEEIFSLLEDIIPKCGKIECNNCQHNKNCKYPILKDVQNQVAREHPTLFEKKFPNQEYQELNTYF